MRAIIVCLCLSFWPLSLAALDREKSDIFHIYERSDARANISRVAETFGLTKTTKHYAVVIGVGEYENGDFDLLPGAKADALRVYDYLTQIGGFDQVWLLTNREATKNRVEMIMVDELRELASDNDRVLFYYTGHGVSENFRDSSRGFLPLSNSNRNSLSSMISMRDIGEWADSLQHVHQLFFVLDSCVSGLAGDLTMSGINTEVERDLGRRGHHLLTAGTGDQLAYATSDGSYFTKAFLDGIQGAADAAFANRDPDGAVSVSELTLYVRQRLRQDLDDRDWLMTPQRTTLNRARLGEFFFTSLDQFEEAAIAGAEIPQGEARDLETQNGQGEAHEHAVLKNDDLQLENDGSVAGDQLGFPTTSSLVTELQRLLTSNACEPNGVDGVLGPDTLEALERYNRYKPQNCDSLVAQNGFSFLDISVPRSLGLMRDHIDKIKSCPAVACEEHKRQSTINFSSREEYRNRFYEIGEGPYYTIVFSSVSKGEVEQKVAQINSSYPNVYAYIYPPFGSNPNWAVMIASKTTREKAVEAMKLARSSGIAADAFIWP